MNTEAAPWQSSNLVGVPAAQLASTAFQADPQALVIAGVRDSHGGLFALLERCHDAASARQVFAQYMQTAFGLGPRDAAAAPDDGPRPHHRASYLHLLQGWGLDANGSAGAVFKGWVQSRFGLAPTFHGAPLQRYPSPAWMGYLQQRHAARWQNNRIHEQLDLLQSYAQWMLARFGLVAEPGARHVTLWRGSTRVDEQLLAGSLRQRQCTVRLNNVVSFSLSRDDAGCFGDWVFEARVPIAKLLFCPGLVAGSVLHGEGEVIVLGGDYDVQARYDA